MDQHSTRDGKPEEYLSFVLRLWRQGKQGGLWMSSLQNSITGERTGFACMDELFEFLRNLTNPKELFDTGKDSQEVTDHNSIDNPGIGN